MREQFVTFEIALKLKELGFDEECFSAYTEDGGLMDIGNYSNYDKIGELDGHSYYISCLSPLWQQVIDYFREEHNIIIDVAEIYKGLCNYHFALNFEWKYFEGTYYEAREAAILKAIELCQKEK